MDPMTALIASSGISAGSALLGSWFGSKEQDKSNQLEYERQKEFAQNSLQWRAADAQKAGLSKFAALGGGSYYTPQSSSGFGLGEAVASAGGAISRSLQQFSLMTQQEALEGARLDNEKKKLDILDAVNKLNPEGKDLKQGTSNILGQSGMVKMPHKDLQEGLDDSAFGVPLKLEALEQALTKDRYGAFKDFKQSFGFLNKGIIDAHEERKWNGTVRSVPVFDLSKYSQKERLALFDALDNSPLLNKAVNSGWSPSDIKEWILQGKSNYLNNILQGFDPIGENTYSFFGKTFYKSRKSL